MSLIPSKTGNILPWRASWLEVRKLWQYRALVAELTKREFSARYQGSVGGVLWSFAQPIFLLVVYTLAFGVILRSRWGFSGGTFEYALMLFAGLIIFNACSECLTRSPLLILSNPNYVTKVLFPLELLPVIQALSALTNALVGVLVWLAGYAVLFGAPSPTALMFPIILVAYFPVLLGICWLFSAVAVYFRDLVHLAALVSHALLFLTPIFYSVDAAPAQIRGALLLNPLSFLIEQLRLVLYHGELPSLRGLAVYMAIGLIFAGLSFMAFRRLRHSFADAL